MDPLRQKRRRHEGRTGRASRHQEVPGGRKSGGRAVGFSEEPTKHSTGDRGERGCNGLNCDPPKRYVEALAPIPVSVTLFGFEEVADVIG